MAEAMSGVTKAMRSMNKQLNLPQIQKIMMDFERESEMMDMKEEMMNDAIDDVMEDAGDEAETDDIVNQVLDEIGISVDQSVRLVSFYSYCSLSVGLFSSPIRPVRSCRLQRKRQPRVPWPLEGTMTSPLVSRLFEKIKSNRQLPPLTSS